MAGIQAPPLAQPVLGLPPGSLESIKQQNAPALLAPSHSEDAVAYVRQVLLLQWGTAHLPLHPDVPTMFLQILSDHPVSTLLDLSPL